MALAILTLILSAIPVQTVSYFALVLALLLAPMFRLMAKGESGGRDAGRDPVL